MFTDPLPIVPYASVPTLAWPLWQAGETRIESLDLTDYLPSGTVAAVSLAIAPSGTGELQATSISFSGATLTVEFSGGVAGRAYLTRITATMADSESIVIPASLYVSPALASWPPSDPPSTDYGSEIIWMVTRGSSNALESSHLLSNAPCSVLNLQANITTVGGWVMLLDAAAIPPDGAVTPIMWWQAQPNSTVSPDQFSPPVSMISGAVLAFSSAASPFVLQSSPTALFSWTVSK